MARPQPVEAPAPAAAHGPFAGNAETFVRAGAARGRRRPGIDHRAGPGLLVRTAHLADAWAVCRGRRRRRGRRRGCFRARCRRGSSDRRGGLVIKVCCAARAPLTFGGFGNRRQAKPTGAQCSPCLRRGAIDKWAMRGRRGDRWSSISGNLVAGLLCLKRWPAPVSQRRHKPRIPWRLNCEQSRIIYIPALRKARQQCDRAHEIGQPLHLNSNLSNAPPTPPADVELTAEHKKKIKKIVAKADKQTMTVKTVRLPLEKRCGSRRTPSSRSKRSSRHT